MTADRFQFQLSCAQSADGRVLNVGCKEDPAHLKEQVGERVTNLDRLDYDDDIWQRNGVKRPIPVDVVHDIYEMPWPFANNEFALVIFGDILEDLEDDGRHLDLLREARRVGQTLCITCPEDTPERDAHHKTTITEARLRDWLALTGWDPVTLRTVDYGFVPRGYFVYATRLPTPIISRIGKKTAKKSEE